MSNENQWPAWLASETAEQQLTALRQISSHENVRGVTCLVVALAGSRNDEVRLWAAEALESSIAPTEAEAASLRDLLQQSEDGEIDYWAATMLGRIGPGASEAVDALKQCVGESLYLPAREQAAWALQQIGPPAASAAETLRAAVEAAPPRLQRIAIAALAAIEKAA